MLFLVQYFKKISSFRSQKTKWLILLPVIILTICLLFIPGLFVFYDSLSNNMSGFISVIQEDEFFNSYFLSISYTIITVFFQLLLGTMSAILVYRKNMSAKMLTIVLFSPYAIPSIVAVVSWNFLIEDEGLYSYFMNILFGFPNSIWKKEFIFFTLCILSIWQFYPFVFVSVLAQLRRIHPNLHRVAQIDGANFWEEFKVILFPSIKSTLFAVLIVRIAFMFTKFDTAWLLAGKTVLSGVKVLPIYVYIANATFENTTFGAAAAILSAFLLFLIILSALFVNKLFNKINKI